MQKRLYLQYLRVKYRHVCGNEKTVPICRLFYCSNKCWQLYTCKFKLFRINFLQALEERYIVPSTQSIHYNHTKVLELSFQSQDVGPKNYSSSSWCLKGNSVHFGQFYFQVKQQRHSLGSRPGPPLILQTILKPRPQVPCNVTLLPSQEQLCKSLFP